jgi:hypothetical protein
LKFELGVKGSRGTYYGSRIGDSGEWEYDFGGRCEGERERKKAEAKERRGWGKVFGTSH